MVIDCFFAPPLNTFDFLLQLWGISYLTNKKIISSVAILIARTQANYLGFANLTHLCHILS